MFFLLKCAFWLALVYAAMLYGFGPVRPVSPDSVTLEAAPRQAAVQVARPVQTVVQDAMSLAGGGIAAVCAQRPAECLADAARLKALFDASGTVEPMATGHSATRSRHADRKSPTSETFAVSSPPDVPMPVADPRRQGRLSRLTSRL